jgi:hypothetical protein
MADITNVNELSVADDLKYDADTGDLCSVPWTDYGETSTIIGWDQTSEDPVFQAKIYYKKLGNLCFCQYYIRGLSNSTDVHFNLPYNGSNSDLRLGISNNLDNGSDNSLGYIYSTNWEEDATQGYFQIVKDYDGGTNEFTNEGLKDVRGSFFFEIGSETA